MSLDPTIPTASTNERGEVTLSRDDAMAHYLSELPAGKVEPKKEEAAKEEKAPEPEKPAKEPEPEREEPEGDDDSASISEQLEALNANILEALRPAVEAKRDAGDKRPLDDLIAEAGEENPLLAKAMTAMQTLIEAKDREVAALKAEVEMAADERFEEAVKAEHKLWVADEAKVAKDFNLTAAERKQVWGHLNAPIANDENGNPITRARMMRFEAAAREVLGSDALEARRTAKPPASAPKVPSGSDKAPATIVTETASGGGPKKKAEVTPGMSMHDIAKLAARERMGIELE